MTSNRFIYFILYAFIASALLLFALQYNSRKGIHGLIEGNQRLADELSAGNALRQAERDILSTESRIRAAVATRDTTYLMGMNEMITEAENNLDTLGKTFTDDSTRICLTRLAYLARLKGQLGSQLLTEYRSSGKFPVDILETSPLARRDSNQIDLLTSRIYKRRGQYIHTLEASVSQNGKDVQRLETLLVIVGLISGGVFFWFIVNRIMHQNRLIRKLDASEKKVQETSRVKENFLANMSHEIRTPLNAILGFTALLKKRNRDPELTEFVHSIGQSGENLLAIVNDILDISKIEAGMIRIESAPFSLRHLMHSIEVMFRGRVQDKALELRVTIGGALPDLYEGDAMRLTQILVNLLGNAVKFTDKGLITVDVSGSTREDTVLLVFTVSDTGIGIPPEKLPVIFDRFLQAEDSIARRYGGTGLGLSIVKDLVVLQQGSIHAESEPNRGTTFTFTIPYALHMETIDEKKSPGTLSGDFSEDQAIRLLVVEDNLMNQNLLRHLFGDWKLPYDMTGNGVAAISALRTTTYTLVLMDIQMPEMDGYATTKLIRDQLRLDLPIIAMTAHAMAGEREKCLSAGMNEYISKPLDENELYALIRRFSGQGSLPSREPRSGEPVTPHYPTIDLRYMKQISNGNIDYEKSVTEDFIESIPADLEKLILASGTGDTALRKRTAHDMKNGIAIMGLTGKLQDHLDDLEYGDPDPVTQAGHLNVIQTVCQYALQEARHFYDSLSKA